MRPPPFHSPVVQVSSGPRSPVKQARREERAVSLAAACCTLVILSLLGRVLLQVPAPAREEGAPAMQVEFLPRGAPAPARPAPEPAPTPSAPAPGRDAPRPSRPAAAPPAPAPAATAPDLQLYARDGRVRLGEVIDPLDPGYPAVPPGMHDERPLEAARKVMERPNPIDYKDTRFAKDWASDGTLGDVAMQGIERGMKRVNKLIHGDDIQVAKARPPPDVRFDPALAENKADLGSQATGDAYKAAPIAHEPPPDLKGEASRRIREALAALEKLPSRCGATQKQALLAPVREHLADLERSEHALTHGADPVMAAQLLPRQADSAYDLARRALWWARKQWSACG